MRTKTQFLAKLHRHRDTTGRDVRMSDQGMRTPCQAHGAHEPGHDDGEEEDEDNDGDNPSVTRATSRQCPRAWD